jgi:DNA-binding NarL/FixJ family response regulator
MRDSTKVPFLSTRMRIAQLVAQGRTNREIAQELTRSVKTVEWHLSRLFRFYGVRSRTELAIRHAAELAARRQATVRRF